MTKYNGYSKNNWAFRFKRKSIEANEDFSFSFILTVYNALDYVKNCLTSVVENMTNNDEIVIVNDASDEETSLYLRQFSDEEERIVLIDNIINKGYTISVNKGIVRASKDVICLINSDTILPKDYRIAMTAFLSRNSGIGICGPLSNAGGWQSIPLVKNDDGFITNIVPFGMSIEDVNRSLRHLTDGEPIIVPEVNGFNFVVRRSVFELIGLFDEKLFPFGYGEENDFCWRAGKSGILCAINPEVYVYHAKSKSFGTTKRKELSSQGSKQLKKKYGSFRSGRVGRTLMTNPNLEDVRKRFITLLKERNVSYYQGSSNVQNLAVVIPGNKSNPNGSTYIRILSWLFRLKSEGEIRFQLFTYEELWKIKEYSPDVLYFQRSVDYEIDLYDIISWSIQNNVLIVHEYDDLLTDLSRKGISPIFAKNFDDIARMVDRRIVSTEMLAAKGMKNDKLIKNNLSNDWWGNLLKRDINFRFIGDRTIGILYFGTWTHDEDLDLIVDVLVRLAQQFDVKIGIVGVSKERKFSDMLNYIDVPIESTPYPDFVRWIGSIAEDYHIGLAPLVSNEFNRYKSDLKFLEYTALGLITVASNIEPYCYLEESKMGVLCSDSIVDWENALTDICLNYNSYWDMLLQAREHVNEFRTIDVNLDLYRKALLK